MFSNIPLSFLGESLQDAWGRLLLSACSSFSDVPKLHWAAVSVWGVWVSSVRVLWVHRSSAFGVRGRSSSAPSRNTLGKTPAPLSHVQREGWPVYIRVGYAGSLARFGVQGMSFTACKGLFESKWVTGSRSGKMELLYSLCCRGGRRWGNLSGMTKLWRDRLQNWSQFSWVQCFNTPTNSCCWTCVYVYIHVNQGTGDAAMGCFKDRKSRTALNSFVNKTLLVSGWFSHGLNLLNLVNKTTVLHRYCSESAASTGAGRRRRLTLVAPASGNPSSCPQTH